ncbi:MAG: transcription factor S [Promethearchaeota archaeon]|nr:MAG: transcription factor S [Candidatus Lokiarchaeota archaeon]
MPDFCPDCDNLLRKRKIKDKLFLVCKCGFQKELYNNPDEIQKSIHKKKKALEKNLLILSEEDKISVHLKIKKDCPKCGNSEAETWQVQIRSSDEPSTHFFKCTKCKYTWRE